MPSNPKGRVTFGILLVLLAQTVFAGTFLSWLLYDDASLGGKQREKRRAWLAICQPV